MKTSTTYSPEARERAARMVLDELGDYPSDWAAIESIATKIGCVAQTLHRWIRSHRADKGQRSSQTTEERERIKALKWKGKSESCARPSKLHLLDHPAAELPTNRLHSR